MVRKITPDDVPDNRRGEGTGYVPLVDESEASAASVSDLETRLTALEALVTALSSSLSGVPSGTIVEWHGTIATIPAGWYFCDGTNGTPDKRNTFDCGADADDGGVAKTTISGAPLASDSPTHTHTTTSDVSLEDHTFSAFTDGPNGTVEVAAGGGAIVASDSHYHDISHISASPHTVTNGAAVSDAATAIPPYRAAVWMMKA